MEANSSASEFKVTVPLLVKFPESVRSEFLAIVKLPPLSIVIALAEAVVEFITLIVCPEEIVTLTLKVGTLPDDQLAAVLH